ncbi:MAG: hypothetical protein AB7T49_06975 [Oligoflexales bacterium]
MNLFNATNLFQMVLLCLSFWSSASFAADGSVTLRTIPVCGRIYLRDVFVANPSSGETNKKQRLAIERIQSETTSMSLVHDLVFYPTDIDITGKILTFLREKNLEGALKENGTTKALAIVQTIESPKYFEIGIGNAIWPTNGLGFQFIDLDPVESCP